MGDANKLIASLQSELDAEKSAEAALQEKCLKETREKVVRAAGECIANAIKDCLACSAYSVVDGKKRISFLISSPIDSDEYIVVDGYRLYGLPYIGFGVDRERFPLGLIEKERTVTPEKTLFGFVVVPEKEYNSLEIREETKTCFGMIQERLAESGVSCSLGIIRSKETVSVHYEFMEGTSFSIDGPSCGERVAIKVWCDFN